MMLNKELIVNFLKNAFPGLLAIYAFGSRVTENASMESDLDLAVLADKKIDSVFLWQQAQKLANQIDCNVDLLDLRSANTVMQNQIINTGERWFSKNDENIGIYEAFILTEKLDLDYLREGLLRDIQCKGKVYGR